jgi:hypothetical protein
MSRRPIASVRVLKLPRIAKGCVRVEVDCSSSVTGITQVLGRGGASLDVPQLVTAAVFEHEARCEGGCDTSAAHAQGDRRVRAWTEQTWEAMRAELVRRYAVSRRN